MNRFIRLSITALIIGLCSFEAGAQVNFTKGSTDHLHKEAIASGKLVFIDIYADWCPPCRTMESHVFSRKDVGELMNKNFINAKYDIDLDIGNELALGYGVKSIPTYLIFDANGSYVARMEGAMKPKEFISNIEMILQKHKSSE